MTVHIPVLPAEVLAALDPQPGAIIVDGTLGGGGHTAAILERIGDSGMLIGIDRDPEAVAETAGRLPQDHAKFLAANYADIPEVLQNLDVAAVDGILLDLGLSSDQLAARDRGFSFHSDGPLDLRFDRLSGEPASRLVNRLGEKHLADLLYEFGEEKLSRRIARKIVQVRHANPIESSVELAELVRRCYPRTRNQRIDPATRTFQALRIAVNDELKWLRVALERLPGCLKPGGKLAIISFHSLEDRMVKQAFRDDDRLEVLTPKPIQAGEPELQANPRSRSAKLRVAQRISAPAATE